MFDNLEDGVEAWRVCRTGWCAGRVDHESCSLVNARLRSLFNYGAGVALASTTQYACSFTSDGGTQDKRLGGCEEVPPCRPTKWWECGWRMDQLRDAIATQVSLAGDVAYNEFIVSAVYWEAHLPSIIEAFVCRDECGKARRAHAQFLAAFDRTHAQTPLVYYGADGFEPLV